MDAPFEPDQIDRRILQLLQRQGRITFDELAAQVGLSGSAALRRVRRLEDAGVIAGYGAALAPERLGLALTAYINVRLAKHVSSGNPIDTFSAALQAWPEVVECAALSGEMDVLLKVLVRDMAHYSRFVLDTLLKHPAVLDCKTSFLLRPLKSAQGVPV